MIDISQLLHQHLPNLCERPLLRHLTLRFFSWLFNAPAFAAFAQRYPQLRGLDFVSQVLRDLNIQYQINGLACDNIPAQGRVIIAANHPIGSIDGLILMHLIGRIRPDTKMVANQLLNQLTPLRSLLFAVDNVHQQTARQNILAIHQHLLNDGALIIFPAGEVSRLSARGIEDGQWQSGFIKLAQRTGSPVLPIHISGRNSLSFYLASCLHKPASTLLLVRQLFNRHRQIFKLTIGGQISAHTLAPLPAKTATALLRQQLYQLPQKRPLPLPSEQTIAPQEDRAALTAALAQCEQLGCTPDGQHIYLYRQQAQVPSVILQEIGRLREIAFRAVQEGTGKRRDLDAFDEDYYHLILWHPTGREIIGAYRFIPVAEQLAKKGLAGLYSHSLFCLEEKLAPCLNQAIELGRSFIQPRYWGKRGLDYLWFGIGAYLARHPQYRYLFGPVSVSGQLPQAAKDLLVSFYRQYFAPDMALAPSRHPYPPTANLFAGKDYQHDMASLKQQLSQLGCTIPTLYKQYVELCENGGVQFMDFGIDPDFNHCIDGLVWVDITRIKPAKKARYINIHQALPSG